MPADAPALAIDELPQRFAPYDSPLFVQQLLTGAVVNPYVIPKTD
jgi:hypothetical protein